MSKLSLSSLHDSREIKLRNIIALEQCHYPKHTHVCSYALFLDYLIDTDKDVDLLLEKDGEQAHDSHRRSCSYYYDIAGEVNKYYRNPMNRSKAFLKRVYFGNPWTGTATIGATFPLVMTLIQT
ncbi:hypothetical protein Bca52824_064839 [Brassica carinata]|uniref:Uncharacterized protein n=1 Tax=Brassica carinata TaxID=52824 RepID=A0A8X7U9F2_BRACI|nr:hypothetical protein Bca52824_085106 [Brassica carinata]KAG2267968.1 hypothetical protein Bca52824_062523 [Brassica carinata]KAG2270284.1 hypothetical protein Bca52824_064839 [Brassica carinata]